jgi:hypothetical protein
VRGFAEIAERGEIHDVHLRSGVLHFEQRNGD